MTENFENRNDEELQTLYQGSHAKRTIAYVIIIMLVVIVSGVLDIGYLEDVAMVSNLIISIIEVSICIFLIIFIKKTNFAIVKKLNIISIIFNIILCMISIVYEKISFSMFTGELLYNGLIIIAPILNIAIFTSLNKLEGNKKNADKSEWFYEKR